MNKHRIGALLAAVALTLSFAGTSLAAVTYATVTGHTEFSEDANKADFWGDNCTKMEFTGEDETYLLDKDYLLVVVKAGSGEFANTKFENAKTGETVFADTNGNFEYDPEGPEDKAISHIIFCEEEETTTTTSDETTDTSTSDTSTTETSSTTTSDETTDTTASETTSSTTSKETTPEGSVEELTPPRTDVLGQPTSSSTVPTGVLLVLAGLLAAALVVIPAAARRR